MANRKRCTGRRDHCTSCDRAHHSRLLRHYPKPEYWWNVLELKSAQPHSERVDFHYLALKFDVGMLDDPADYEALALGAIDL